MAYDGIAARGRRLSCLVALFVGIIVPTTLKLFFIADTSSSQRSYHWESRLRSLEADADADVSLVNDYGHSIDGETDVRSIASNKMMITEEYRRKIYDYFTAVVHDDPYELSRILVSERIVHQIDRKRSIHAIVATVIAFLVPLIAFLYASIVLKKTEGVGRSSKKQRRRKERILLGLEECRIQLPTTTMTEDTTTTDNDEQRECPICLSAFTAGEVVIASKHCHCSIRSGVTHGTDSIASVDDKNSVQHQRQHQHHRICFHENCIFTWLSRRKFNPKKLCPCCRHPFLSSK